MYNKIFIKMSMINEFSSIDEINSFLGKIYNNWITTSYILDIQFDKIFRIQSGKYIGYPNITYIKLLYTVIMSDILSIREDTNLQEYRQFLIQFFMYLEENAITGIISVRNKNIQERIKFLKKELNITNVDDKTISNTQMVIFLQ
jgi:hypothetical protein